MWYVSNNRKGKQRNIFVSHAVTTFGQINEKQKDKCKRSIAKYSVTLVDFFSDVWRKPNDIES